MEGSRVARWLQTFHCGHCQGLGDQPIAGPGSRHEGRLAALSGRPSRAAPAPSRPTVPLGAVRFEQKWSLIPVQFIQSAFRSVVVVAVKLLQLLLLRVTS